MDAYSAREGGDKRVAEPAVRDTLADAHPTHPEPYNPEQCPECSDGTEPVVAAVRGVEGVQRAGFSRRRLYVAVRGPHFIETLETANRYGWTLKGYDPSGLMVILAPAGGDA